MSAQCTLKVGRTRSGFRLRVEGRGTLRESPAVHEFVVRALESGPGSVVIDLSSCDYLDSTFLGCLVDLHRRFGLERPPRFEVAAPPDVSLRVFSPTRLDAFLNIIGEGPDTLGEDLVLTPTPQKREELGHHVMECHRRLAEVEGPHRADFERIADQLERDLVNR